MPRSGLRHPYSLVKVHRLFGHQRFCFLHSFYWPGPGHPHPPPSPVFLTKHLPCNSPVSPNHTPNLFASTLKKRAIFFFLKCVSISKNTRRHNRQVLNQLFNLRNHPTHGYNEYYFKASMLNHVHYISELETSPYHKV